MKIFAIGDLHLSFGEGIEKPMDVFGELWKDHTERLKEKWNLTVSPEDIVIICGDIRSEERRCRERVSSPV